MDQYPSDNILTISKFSIPFSYDSQVLARIPCPSSPFDFRKVISLKFKKSLLESHTRRRDFYFIYTIGLMTLSSNRLSLKAQLLYRDLCISNGLTHEISLLTQRQIAQLLSMEPLIDIEQAQSGNRTWKIKGKKKHGGHLTQSFARIFFTENF